MGEFELIRRFFQRPARKAALGIGDDCALLTPQPGMQLAISTDMLVEGRHFMPDVQPKLLGHKALAVNLSDLAASGAQPLAFTLALSLPRADAAWCQGFADGLFALADQYGCELIGGDTTQGPLNICITVFGEVPHGAALLRSGAQVGDDIWVSGTLGDARLALDALLRQHALPQPVLAQTRVRLEQPSPRVALGTALRGIATSALDVSDGLVGDLGHILEASGVGARIDANITRSLLQARKHPLMAALATSRIDACTLAGGDDYELCFTAPPAAQGAVREAAAASHTPVTCIGRIEAERGVRIMAPGGQQLPMRFTSFDHFG